ncbi:MAG: sigma-54 dependent transcriptional regulator [Pseudomonadota bacterium]|nr:sigma-54 dependent transcriptional regulator [Pseudomonadota bacterium]
MSREHILVIDDEPSLGELLTLVLEREGYVATRAESGEEGLELFDSLAPDLVLTDLNMPGIDGIEILRQIKTRSAQRGRDVPVILLTAYGSVATAVLAMREGAFDYVAKPFHNDELRLIVKKALAMRALEADNARMRVALGERYQLGQFVGTSPRMQEVYSLVRRIMGTRISCLIGGESGTGKELLARAVHYGSERARHAFVPVNCGAIAENLFESELFGYKKGAFTGAARDKVGFFEAADGGTLFLDEVGEMPLASQVKVLRALSEKKVTPVGSTVEVAVDVRIVAATNRDLTAEVAAGRFREDLYYRLNVVQIDMPPLRERAEDVPMLVQHFVERFAEEYKKRVGGVTPEALRMLRAYPFPGNVRELQNIVERAVALEAGALLTPSSLPERVQGVLSTPQTEPAGTGGEGDAEAAPEGLDLEARLAEVERSYLVRALAASGGNRTQAARLLGVTFRSLRYRLVKFGMDEGEE